MTTLSSETLHASCVAIGGIAVLIGGPSGSGKSDLALRLIDRGARLVSDDYTVVRRLGGRLLAAAPPTIAGKLEVRGVGIVAFDPVEDIPVALFVDLGAQVQRLPEAADTRLVAGVELPVLALAGLEVLGADQGRARPRPPRIGKLTVPRSPAPERILLVTGLSGAGKSTALRTLEDLGWEVVDNLPLSLLEQLLSAPLAQGSRRKRPLAIGIDSRTRDFKARHIVKQIRKLADEQSYPIETLFLECSGAELLRRYSETRRRHPLAPDRPPSDGIAEERELMAPLRRWSEHVIDTTDSDPPAFQQQLRQRFGRAEDAPTLTLSSFGFARGLPRNADIVLDVRFLRNPHWDNALRPLTGLDDAVGAYIAADESYEAALGKIEDLLLTLLPRYRAEGKSYISIAFGCTGGRHRSVHVAERIAQRLRNEGFSPTVEHRDLAFRAIENVEDAEQAGDETFKVNQ